MDILNLIGIIGFIISGISTLIIIYFHCKNNKFYNIFIKKNVVIPENKYTINKNNKIIILKNPDNKIKVGIAI